MSTISEVDCSRSSGTHGLNRPRVWLADVFCFTPWYTAALAAAMSDAGAGVRLICGELKQEPAYFQSLGLEPDAGPIKLDTVTRICPVRLQRALRVCEATINSRFLIHALESRRSTLPDVLHLQQLPMLRHGLRSDLSLIDAARRAGVPVVHTVHNLLPHDSGERFRSIYAELYRRVNRLICHSEWTAQRLTQEFGIPPKKITVIPHGPLFAPEHRSVSQYGLSARARLGLPVDRAVILWQGVIAPYKGVDILLKAWTLLIRSWGKELGPLPLLLIAGKGLAELEADVRSAVHESNGTIRADLRYIPTSKLRDYYSAADVLVYPYRSITTSGALLTGLSYEKPIIASCLPPFEEYLADGVNALFVEPGHVGALAEALRSLLSDEAALRLSGNASSTSRYTCLLNGAKQNAMRFTGWADIAKQTLALYEVLALENNRAS